MLVIMGNLDFSYNTIFMACLFLPDCQTVLLNEPEVPQIHKILAMLLGRHGVGI